MERPFSAYNGDEPYIFVSYAHDDAALVYPEISRIREEGFNIWYDEGISPGSAWRDEVALALTQCSVFLYFLTPHSVASTNCLNEVNFCLSRERKVLPLYFEKTDLPIGLELSLSSSQAIIRSDHTATAYVKKLNDALNLLLPGPTESVPIPKVMLEESPGEIRNLRNSIAILPFENQSSDPDNEYLCNGITEELITGLARVEGLKVASQLSSFGLKGQNLEPTAIGKRLNVSNVLTGSLQKSGDKVRITVSLSNAQDNMLVWSERYDSTLADVFELQEDVANKVINRLELVEKGIERNAPIIDTGTNNAVAYEKFLSGMHEYNKYTRTGLQRAREYFADSIKTDPKFGRAYWFDCRTCFSQRDQGYLSQEECQELVSVLLDRMRLTSFEPPMPAIWIERTLAPEQIPDIRLLAFENLAKIKDGDKSWHGFQYAEMGYSLITAGLLNGGEKYLASYLELSPAADTNLSSQYVNLLFALGRFEKAVHHLSNVLTRHPDDFFALGTRAMLYSRTGQYNLADSDLGRLVRVFPRNFAQFYDLYWHRELDAAKAYYEWMDGQENLMILFKIWGCFLLGYVEKGMDYLEQANYPPYQIRTAVIYPLTVSLSREVTSHPRYKALLEKHTLDDKWRQELMTRVNDLEPITGIHVSLDEDY